MTYQVVTAESAEALAESINQMLSNGWALQGGVTFCEVNWEWQNKLFAQAVVWPHRCRPPPQPTK